MQKPSLKPRQREEKKKKRRKEVGIGVVFKVGFEQTNLHRCTRLKM